MPRKPTTYADRARALRDADPTLSAAAIARQLSTRTRTVSRQAVREALLAQPGAKPGRKVDLPARVERLRRELAEAERELAATLATGHA